MDPVTQTTAATQPRSVPSSIVIVIIPFPSSHGTRCLNIGRLRDFCPRPLPPIVEVNVSIRLRFFLLIRIVVVYCVGVCSGILVASMASTTPFALLAPTISAFLVSGLSFLPFRLLLLLLGMFVALLCLPFFLLLQQIFGLRVVPHIVISHNSSVIHYHGQFGGDNKCVKLPSLRQVDLMR